MSLFSPFAKWAKSLRINDRSGYSSFFWSLSNPFSYKKYSETDLLNNGFLSNADVYSIIKKIAITTSQLPFKIMDGENELDSGEIYNLVWQPNEYQSFTEVREEEVMTLLIAGEVFIYRPIESIGFDADKRYVLPIGSVEIFFNDNSNYLLGISHYQVTLQGRTFRAEKEEIIHIKYADLNPHYKTKLKGLSPLQAGGLSLNASNNAAIAQSTSFENRGVNKLISGVGGEGGLLRESDIANIDKGTKNRFGGAHKFNSVVTIQGGAKVHDLGMTNAELELLKVKKEYLRDLCNVFGVPSELFNDPDNKTHANRREANKSYYTDVVLPLAKKINNAYESQWLKRYSGEVYIEIDTNKIEALSESPEERIKTIQENRKLGIITPNEAREMIGLDPLSQEDMNQAKPLIGANKTNTNEQASNNNN